MAVLFSLVLWPVALGLVTGLAVALKLTPPLAEERGRLRLLILAPLLFPLLLLAWEAVT